MARRFVKSGLRLGSFGLALVTGLAIAAHAGAITFSLDDNENNISEAGLGCGPSNPIVGGADTGLTGDDRCFEWTPSGGFTEGAIRAVSVASVSGSRHSPRGAPRSARFLRQ